MTKNMVNQNTANSEDLYRNPFSEYSANVMHPDTIVNLWCNPFTIFGNFAGISERDIYCESNPLVFVGGRGSGKTMFLRYWSYEVQKRLHTDLCKNTDNQVSLLDTLNNKEGVGVYLRIDGPVLRDFNNYGLTNEKWLSIFTHYFELLAARNYITIIIDLINCEEIKCNKEQKDFCNRIQKLIGGESRISSVSEILDILDERLDEVKNFRSDIKFIDKSFIPTKAFSSQSLSFRIPEIVKTSFKSFKDNFKFVLLIDEYENFLPDQQRMINTLLKFVKPSTTFRIGMRIGGFRTYATVTEEDFIKLGRDYQTIEFEEILRPKSTGYQNFLKEIAKKRLEKVQIFKQKQLTDISVFLGKKESLEQETQEIVKSNPEKLLKHFDKILPKEIAKELKAKDSPLIELLGILWYIRGEKANDIKKAINDYQSEKKTKLARKFQYDLVNKYKLSLTILICSIYRVKKGYYSFNTFSYLSSGIVGHFIELCRYSFRFAEFESKEDLFEGRISQEIQTKAARQYAINELQQIKRIEDYGNLLYQMAENLGNIFREYHKDEFIRYPETNQFSLDKSMLEDKYQSAFDAALKWSVIQRKPNLQQSAPGDRRTEIFTLNRVFSPEFQISYRTRGGINEEYDSKDIKILMETTGVKPKRDLVKRTDVVIKGLGQQKLEF